MECWSNGVMKNPTTLPLHHSMTPSCITEILARFEGVISLAARDLKTGATVAYRSDCKCPTASVIKLPLLVHALLLARECALSLEETITLRVEDKVGGSGILKDLSAGLTVSVQDVCTLMIALSDNTATNLLIDRLGIEGVNRRMEALGCS